MVAAGHDARVLPGEDIFLFCLLVMSGFSPRRERDRQPHGMARVSVRADDARKGTLACVLQGCGWFLRPRLVGGKICIISTP